MNASNSHSQVNGVRTSLRPVGVWGERTVIDEVHQRSRRYPDPLVPIAGVRVKGFSISLDVELSGEPEAAPFEAGELLQLLSNLVEDRVGRFNRDGLVDFE